LYFEETVGNFDKFIDTVGEGADYKPLDIYGLTPLTGTFVSGSAATSILTVDIFDKLNYPKEVTDLVTSTDFIVKKVTDSVEQNPSGISNVNERYALTGVTIVQGDAYALFRKTANNATDTGYEWVEADAITFTGEA